MKWETFGPEWFGPVIGTMVLSLLSWIFSQIGVFPNIFFNLGKIIFFIGFLLFLSILFLWILHFFKAKTNDFSSLNRTSFTAFLGVLGYIISFFYITYVSSSFSLRFIFLTIFILAVGEVLGVNLLLWYKLFSGEFDSSDITYASLVPSIALASNSILSDPMLPPLSPWFLHNMLIREFLYSVILFTTGIAFFQFVFLGSASLLNVARKGELTTTMIPVGAASIILINIIILPTLGFFNFPKSIAFSASFMLWGFEAWNMVLSLIIAVKKLGKTNPNMGIWAYVFPLGISSFADFLLYLYTKILIFYWTIPIISIAIVVLYAYAWHNTIRIIRNSRN
ncbi:hypothetical protein CM19_01385 [Candidatus Acidianus copahuensis]|uniref:C4-dicarboxylate ABC transporter n=1 Tax=Candidatus Acidianus copahuensis TaxID=1160895 RepID=A0A031LVC1_9CREN|nr:hypothetical protein [Candidatus Acidianus copahuensis]EZQ11439.1 hypothetical protein CM19_01385 [Candidatus Acidianus copahuensis]